MSSIYEIERLLREIHQEIPEGLKGRVEALEAQLRARRWGGSGDGEPGFSLLKALRGLALGDWTGAHHEREVLFETREMATTPDSAGGYLVPAQQIPELIEMLRANSVVIESGATVLDGLVGSPVKFPKQTQGATVYWVGENEAITPSDAAFGQLVLTPHKAAALVKLSNELLGLALPRAEAVLRADLARQLALAVDLAALRGSGASGQPQGVANTSGINTVALGTNGAYLTSLDLFFDMAAALEEDNALTGKLGFVMHPKAKAAMRKLKAPQYSGDTGGEYLLAPLTAALLATDRALEEAVGYPCRTTTQIPTNLVKGTSSNCTEVYFANWQDLVIAQWNGLSILGSNLAGDAFAKDQTWIRVVLSLDIGLRHAESFCLCNDLRV